MLRAHFLSFLKLSLRILWYYQFESLWCYYHFCYMLLSFECLAEAVAASPVLPVLLIYSDLLTLWCYHLDAMWPPFGFCGVVCSWCLRIASIWCFHGTCCWIFCPANLQFIALLPWCCCMLVRLHHLATDYKIYSCVAFVPHSISVGLLQQQQQPLVD